MMTAVLFLLGGLLALIVGATGLVRGAVSMARRLGVSALVIGLTVVAYGTSAPELIVSLYAAMEGSPDIALGNVVGSNIGNVGLILGCAALLSPIGARSQLLKTDVPIMIGVSALLLGLLSDGMLGRWDGVLLLLSGVGYTLFSLWNAAGSSGDDSALETALPAEGSWLWDLLYGGGGLVLLVIGARLLVDGAVVMATAAGLSTAVIGLTVVAVGTSLPEFATSAVAAWRGEGDIALGNVVGSNIFNILGILGITACIQPVDASGLSWIDGGVMLAFAAAILPLLWTGYTFSRVEGGALLLGYGAYLAVLIL